jgi:hypothetical protein
MPGARFPPIEDILASAQIQVAPTSLFDLGHILACIRSKGGDFAQRFKSAVSKVFGLYDAAERVKHIDVTVVESKQNFLKLHETGHHEIPTHRKLFPLFQECEKTPLRLRSGHRRTAALDATFRRTSKEYFHCPPVRKFLRDEPRRKSPPPPADRNQPSRVYFPRPRRCLANPCPRVAL